jgi:hypothetical protein
MGSVITPSKMNSQRQPESPATPFMPLWRAACYKYGNITQISTSPSITENTKQEDRVWENMDEPDTH